MLLSSGQFVLKEQLVPREAGRNLLSLTFSGSEIRARWSVRLSTVQSTSVCEEWWLWNFSSEEASPAKTGTEAAALLHLPSEHSVFPYAVGGLSNFPWAEGDYGGMNTLCKHMHTCAHAYTHRLPAKEPKAGMPRKQKGPRCFPHGYALVQPFKCRLSFRPRWQFPGGDLWERW